MKNFLILLLILVVIISGLILLLIFNYIDPFVSNDLIIYSFIFSIFLFFSSIFTLIIYFFKKVYYRGRVVLNHISTSFRQSSFIAIFFIGVIFFIRMGIPAFISGLLFFILLFFLELFIQNTYD